MSTKITLLLPEEHQTLTIDCLEGESLLEAMLRQKVIYRADCGGRGTCGKCRVKVLAGELKVTAWDTRVLSEEELQQGYRLSCKAYPEDKLSIELISGYETAGYEVVADLPGNRSGNTPDNKPDNKPDSKPDNKADAKLYNIADNDTDNRTGDEAGLKDPVKQLQVTGISGDSIIDLAVAIDLGTTTLAYALVDRIAGRVIKTHTSLNPQRNYGADVISRIKASADGKKDILKSMIRLELEEGIRALISMAGIGPNQLNQIVIAGNTTMIHLLMGYDCSTLGVYPFTPVNISIIRMEAKEVFSDIFHMPLTILPGISAFIGGDILAGLLSCGFDRTEELCLLVDLGTNGELALGNRNKILVTSTAAGPAFEGVNISCGVGSIPGAISHVTIEEEECRYETIGGKPPVGICGTGVIELTSELLRDGKMDETGLLADPFFEQGYDIGGMKFLQRDVRELQMAKAAIRAGIELLVSKLGIACHEINKVYLAGGFGYKMDVSKALHIGLFPPELAGKIEAVGNCSLGGAITSLTDKAADIRMEKLMQVAQEVHLSNESDFSDLYIEAISFQTKG